jgi:hypothetical protein
MPGGRPAQAAAAMAQAAHTVCHSSPARAQPYNHTCTCKNHTKNTKPSTRPPPQHTDRHSLLHINRCNQPTPALSASSAPTTTSTAPRRSTAARGAPAARQIRLPNTNPTPNTIPSDMCSSASPCGSRPALHLRLQLEAAPLHSHHGQECSNHPASSCQHQGGQLDLRARQGPSQQSTPTPTQQRPPHPVHHAMPPCHPAPPAPAAVQWP